MARSKLSACIKTNTKSNRRNLINEEEKKRNKTYIVINI